MTKDVRDEKLIELLTRIADELREICNILAKK